MSVVVGLDPSLRAAGIALIRDPATASTPNVPKLLHVGEEGSDDVSLIGRATRVRRQRDRILRQLPAGVTLVMIEAIPKVNPTPKAASYFVERGALCLELAHYLAGKGIPVVDVTVGTIKLFATGNGRAEKPAVMAAMKELWPGAPIASNDNRSDALAIATIGAQHLGWYQPELPFHYAPNINWPKGLRR
ncbi:hypothetical protein CH302_00985 [Rhodococcus sp. 15-2388-1-1a]|uniref:crossover junction endodeoxyribonuclease RuvC n=1 Tax=Nocardiaceae TaxID=85025 RepID=UPI00068A2A96|nr:MULTISPECIES: crossover junction endodeoxyribonuclease RuvC [Rhodococcus]OZF05229.1 hypothetical protein CH302_00985 [Rhodococcus sp. 15-2388-1-1a]